MFSKCPNFIRTKGQHLHNLMNWVVRMGNTRVQGNDSGRCKRQKSIEKKLRLFEIMKKKVQTERSFLKGCKKRREMAFFFHKIWAR